MAWGVGTTPASDKVLKRPGDLLNKSPPILRISRRTFALNLFNKDAFVTLVDEDKIERAVALATMPKEEPISTLSEGRSRTAA